MPELPEVEILVRHLAPILKNRSIQGVVVHRLRIIRPTTESEFRVSLTGAQILGVTRRAKYLLFEIRGAGKRTPSLMLGHLGMTGRMYLLPNDQPIPKHAAVSFDLGKARFIFEDTRYFGRLTLDASAIDQLGPEPLSGEFTDEYFYERLKGSNQAIKVKLLDQSLVAGLGNIYAGEACFRARIPPRLAARRLTLEQTLRLRLTIQEVLREAIDRGSSLAPDFSGAGARDGIFYYSQSPDVRDAVEERFQVYDRVGRPCVVCGATIRRIVQAARSTYFCPNCQSDARRASVRG